MSLCDNYANSRGNPLVYRSLVKALSISIFIMCIKKFWHVLYDYILYRNLKCLPVSIKCIVFLLKVIISVIIIIIVHYQTPVDHLHAKVTDKYQKHALHKE